MEETYRKRGTAMRCTVAFVLTASIGLEAYGSHAGKHVEPYRYQQPAMLTYEASYSTVAPPLRLGHGAFMDFESW